MEDQHEVTISKPFLIGKFQVTRGLYKKVIGSLPPKVEEDLQYTLEDDKYSLPIAYVDSFDAEDFCEELNNTFSNYLPLGYKFDLPSEAQWEYACRAGTTTALNNGMNLRDTKNFCPNLAKIGWFHTNSPLGLHPVGLKQPNAWGIYDMLGNVEEWCKDFYYRNNYPNETVDPISVVPKNFVPESMRILKGGSIYSSPSACRSAARRGKSGNEKEPNVGFRLALVPIRNFDTDIYQGPDEEPYIEVNHDSKDNPVQLSNNIDPNIKKIPQK
jgi:formylglycine-generating enzyme required for sulfatase activity